MIAFNRYVGIDYSGAETPTASLKGLRVYLSEGRGHPAEVPPPPSPRKYWTRKGIAEWVVERLAEDTPTPVGIDHGFSFPSRYFETHGLLSDWPRFLDDFERHWPTAEDHVYVEFVRDGIAGNGAARIGPPEPVLSADCGRLDWPKGMPMLGENLGSSKGKASRAKSLEHRPSNYPRSCAFEMSPASSFASKRAIGLRCAK